MFISSTPLDSGWEVAQRLPARHDVSLPAGGEKIWLPAVVPGHVHGDLQRAGVLGDPFYRQQETGAQWVDEADWTYRTTFTVDAARINRGLRHFLDFAALDTLARVFLNGDLLAVSENYFVPLRCDVTGKLRDGENEVKIEFDSALRVGRARASAYLGDGTSERGSQSYFNFGPRAFVRKPQYMFGWDWGPELVSCGIAGPVTLVTVPHAEIVDWRVEYDFVDALTVDMRIALTVDKYHDGPLTVGASLYAPGDNTPSVMLPDAPGRHTVELTITNQKIARWNPHDAVPFGADLLVIRPRDNGGPQKRYLLNLSVWETSDDPDEPKEIVSHKGVSIAFRTIELVREPDADGQGESFLFRVNGVDTFIKGANWIPDGSFPAEITPARLRERLTQARDMGCNMLRVWGGGLYESDDFYNLCDELGILVWQDFTLACSMYPDDLPEFVESVRAEAVANVRRLRHHACLALWCGGNENAELFQNRWAGPTQATRFLGEQLILSVFPDVLKAHDPHTPYWPNSPWGGTDVTSEDFGDSHYWNVWHSKKPDSTGDWTHYAESTTRFSSEFGFAAPCGWAAWKACLAPPDETPFSPVVQAHDKTRKGYSTYVGFIEKHFPPVKTLDDLIYYGQANQAMALQFGVEHYRRMKGRCWGTLFWQLNDCWPTHSWAVIDSAGEPKAAYYAAKRFYTPLLLSLKREGDAVEAYLVNDTLSEVSGTLKLQIRLLSGGPLLSSEESLTAPEDFVSGILASVEESVTARANAASGVLASVTLPETGIDSSPSHWYAHATFTASEDADEILAENLLLLDEPKNLHPPESVVFSVSAAGNGTAEIWVGSMEGFAAFVWLHFEDLSIAPTFEDNWFHILPMEARTVRVTGLPPEWGEEEIKARLRGRSL